MSDSDRTTHLLRISAGQGSPTSRSPKLVLNAARQWPLANWDQGVGVPTNRRQQQYGVTDKVYATLNELEEYGLVKRVFDNRSTSAPKDERVVDRFQVNTKGLEQDAYTAVLNGLTGTSLRIGRWSNRR